ncbi:MAG TPA: PaaI family thioesterase [Solimonas sp.]|nr:PaaI family thioesterase [Solimonas sp.]
MSDPTPSNLETIATGFINHIPHMRACGIVVDSAAREGVEVRLPYRPEWLGDLQRGVIHTGVITMLVDSASGLAVLTAMPAPEPIATLDLRMDYLRPAHRDLDLVCRAECFRLTSHIAFVRTTVWQDDREAPVAIGQAAFMRSSGNRKRNAA